MTERPADACQIHRAPTGDRAWARPDPGYRTCARCVERLRSWLKPGTLDEDGRPVSIPDLYDLLDPTPGTAGDSRGRRAPGFGTVPPASLHVIAMRDPRSKGREVAYDGPGYRLDPATGEYVAKADAWIGADGRRYFEDESPVRSPVQLLGSWASWVVEERGLDAGPRARVADLAEFLDRHLDWLTRRDDVTEFARDLARLRGQLRTATGDPRPTPDAYCIHVLGDGSTCGAPIYMPDEPRAPDEPITTLPTLRCDACGADYQGTAILLMREENQRHQRALQRSRRAGPATA